MPRKNHPKTAAKRTPYQQALDAAARVAITAAVAAAGGSRTAAARALGLTERTFYREISRLGLLLPDPVNVA
jgi:DNA-binding NtrC family response regulator